MRTAVWYLVPFVAGLVILQLVGRFDSSHRVFSVANLTGGISRNAPDSRGADATVPQSVAAGRLSPVQDQYLQRLVTAPGDDEAMRRLVAVRRQMAGDNPLTLLRQSAALQQAIALGETAEQYSEDRMRILALADTRAATEIVAEGGHNSGRSSVRVTPGLPRNTSSALGVSSPRSSAAPVDSHGAQSRTQPSEDASVSGTVKANAALPVPPDSRRTRFPVSVHSSDQPIVSSRGDLFGVDCQQRAFMLHGSNGDEEYFAAPNIVMYVRGSQSEKLGDFCGLQRFLGHTVIVWSTVEGHRSISTALSVLMPAP